MIKGEVRTFGEAEAGDRRPSSRCVEVSATTFAAEGITVGECRQQKQQQSQEPPQLSPKKFPSYLRSMPTWPGMTMCCRVRLSPPLPQPAASRARIILRGTRET